MAVKSAQDMVSAIIAKAEVSGGGQGQGNNADDELERMLHMGWGLCSPARRGAS
jgi:hypothetical protein